MEKAAPAHPSATPPSRDRTGLRRTAWHMEKTTRPSTKMLGLAVAGHRKLGALLGVLRQIGQREERTTRRRSSVER